MNPGSSLDLFGEQLVAAGHRRAAIARWRGKAARLAAGAAVVAAVFGVGAVVRPPDASAAIEVRHAGNLITVRLVDLEARPEEVEEELRAAGLDVDVTTGATPVQLVGRFVRHASSQPLPDDLEVLDEDGAAGFTSFALPDDWDGSLQLVLGREAQPGESYIRSINAFADGEPFACTGWRSASLGAIAPQVAQTDLVVSWRALESSQSRPRQLASDELEDMPWSSYIVIEAVSVAPNTVIVTVAHPSTPAPATGDPAEDATC